MDENALISKKELLQKYGVSYGALYRWKRQGLIPEDWFIRRSTPTGQETFFPEALITQRVELILSGRSEGELAALAKKLRGEEEESWTLTVGTAYGERSFPLQDLRSLRLTRGGVSVDLMGHIIAISKEEQA